MSCPMHLKYALAHPYLFLSIAHFSFDLTRREPSCTIFGLLRAVVAFAVRVLATGIPVCYPVAGFNAAPALIRRH
jgi:hypothetical protein